MEKHILGLNLPTDPRWVNIAEKNIHDILIDHAYCEQKAASSCISLIIQYPEMEKMVETLTPIVAEEWGHFERVMDELKKRGMPFGMPRKDEYVDQLQKLIKRRKSGRSTGRAIAHERIDRSAQLRAISSVVEGNWRCRS